MRGRFPSGWAVGCAALVAVAVVAAGCQPRKVLCCGDTGASTEPVEGELLIARGYDLQDRDRQRQEQNLLYALILFPDLGPAEGMESSFEWGVWLKYTVFTRAYNTSTGWVRMELKWDVWNDVVWIAGKPYERARGNALVVIRWPSGATDVTQLPGPGPHVTRTGALEHFQRLMKSNALISSVRLRSAE
jgi:hypothetical protein